MSKNAIIALIIGLIIGGLAIFLIMGFTEVGTTMIISYQGDKVKETTPIATVTPTETDEVNFDSEDSFTVSDLEISNLKMKNGKEFSATMDAKGSIFYKDDGESIALVEEISVTSVSMETAETLNSVSTTLDQANTLQEAPDVDTNALTSYADSGNTNKEDAAANAAGNALINIDGTDDTALENRTKCLDFGDQFADKLTAAINVDGIELSSSLVITLTPEVEEFMDSYAEANGIENSWKYVNKFITWLVSGISSAWDAAKNAWSSR